MDPVSGKEKSAASDRPTKRNLQEIYPVGDVKANYFTKHARRKLDADVNANYFTEDARRKLDEENYKSSLDPCTPHMDRAESISTNSEDGSAGPSSCRLEGASGMQVVDAGSAQRQGPLNKRKDRGAVIKVKLDLEKDHGRYVLEVTRVEGSTNEVERANQMAESAATLLLQSEILRDMGERLRAQYRESIQSIFGNSALEV